MNKLKKIITAVILLFMITACEKNEYEIVINNREVQGINVSIDGSPVTLESNKDFTTLMLKEGEHTVSSGGIFHDTINVEYSGLLSSGKKNSAQFIVVYQPKNIIGMRSVFECNGAILVSDSTVIYAKVGQDALVDDMKVMIKFIKKKNRKVVPPELRVLSGTSSIIKKSWDYTSDNLSDSISVNSTGAQSIGGATKIVLCNIDYLANLAKISNLYKYEKIENPELINVVNEYFDLINKQMQNDN